MAGSKYAYVRNFELPDPLLPGTFLIFRLDGHSFHRFSTEHQFTKPNDVQALMLMDHAARDVMEEYKDIVLAFGESDEYSFLLRKSTSLYNRRESKICSTLTSYFTSCYVFHWREYFPDVPLLYPPSFDGRIVVYPSSREIRDYFSWRQADTHINNLYNTIFWALVQQGGKTTTDAHAALRGTVSSQKHEMLFKSFGVNYNEIDARFRKGSILVRDIEDEPTPPELPEPTPASSTAGNQSHSEPTSAAETSQKSLKQKKNKAQTKAKTKINLLHCDIIKDEFWDARPHLLE
ncbi:tRNA-His guanylyltransferase [Pleurotus pulmonarius]|nr:tRNA-His guanylyltransferase [Pleurotus pulmonarius]KAF4597223.1 tRNA-His guanylyltransferase [Pleurotus pulmonarius]